MFSGSSLSDRLKAAVNQLEATGTSLQAKAISAANVASAQASERSSRPTTPAVAPKSTAAAVKASASTQNTPAAATSPIDTAVPAASASTDATPTSPTSFTSTTSHLAESALSGLRRSLQLTRSSSESARPTAAELDAASETPTVGGSRATSPPPKASGTGAFSLGSSLGPSAKPTPGVSPAPPESQLEDEEPTTPTIKMAVIPPSDPSDPSTFPLPMSPVDEEDASKALLPGIGDPLGASPLLHAATEDEPPALGLGASKDEVTPPRISISSEMSEKSVANGDKGRTSLDSVKSGSDMGKDDADDAAKRLAKMERRYEDLSKRYTDLLSQSHAANKVLKELTPLEGIADADALEGWVRMVNGKVEMINDELARMQAKMKLQDSRMEELRDTHRLEGGSQTEIITKLRSQLNKAESDMAGKGADLVTLGQLRSDLAKAQTHAKEEEEKRTKAISLLKTVRQKLVKVEKEKELVERDRAEERAERSKAADEVEKIKTEKEREVTKLRKGFEREIAGIKERAEKDLAAKKAAWELEMITTKAGHAKEISNKSTKINGLEAIVKELHASNAAQFSTIQSRQAEAETARADLEAAETRNKELEFQLREATEALAIAEDAPRASSRPASRAPSPSRGTSAAEVQRLLADADSRAEVKLSELRTRVRALERERNELEEDWAAKLAQRVRELENVRTALADKESEAARNVAARAERDARLDAADATRRDLERQISTLQTEVEEARADVTLAAEAERAAREELASAQGATGGVQTQLEEAKALADKLRANNKTLRDEMRKVQSNAQLLERQRNPGVGYWAQGANAPPPTMTSPPQPSSPAPETPARTGSAGAGSVKSNNDEEEVNLEYLRNVILQFLEHKEMRANLVRVLSVILRFTPQELRRLEAKLNS